MVLLPVMYVLAIVVVVLYNSFTYALTSIWG